MIRSFFGNLIEPNMPLLEITCSGGHNLRACRDKSQRGHRVSAPAKSATMPGHVPQL